MSSSASIEPRAAARVRRSDERSDEELARAAQSGDSAAFERLVERMLDPVYNFLLRSQRAADAEELAHETLVRAWQKLSTYRSEYRFSTWIFTLARRLSAGATRARSRRAVDDLAAIDAAIKRAQNDEGLWTNRKIFTTDGHERDLSDEFGESVLVDRVDDAGERPPDQDGTWYTHVIPLGYKAADQVDQALKAALGTPPGSPSQ